jgi:hypothetical protein
MLPVAFAHSNQATAEFCAQGSTEPCAQKRLCTEDPEQQASVDLTLRKYIDIDLQLLSTLGWEEYIQECQGRGDIGDLEIEHPASCLLRHIGKKGVPIVLTTPP